MTRRAARHLAALALVAWLAGCATPDKPVRATVYDFGLGATVAATASAQGMLEPLILADIDASGALDGSALLYRLGYADEHQLRPYAQARWSAPPPRLIRQRLRDQLARQRAVLDLSESAALARTGGKMPRVLRMELVEFAHHFETQQQSAGVLRLSATLFESTPAGEHLLAQRSFLVRRPAPTADAPGGVRALTAATDAAAGEISQWLQQVR